MMTRVERSEPPGPDSRQPTVIVTGMSGAGKSTALALFEDLGFEAVDNLPLGLFEQLMALAGDRPLAVGIDSRTRAFCPARLLTLRDAYRAAGRSMAVVFLDCTGAELIRRFSKTRRRHPLAGDRPASDGVSVERSLLAPLREAADMLIDTSDGSIHDLRRLLAQRFTPPHAHPLTLTLMSFSYARGLPREADIVFDMRFLDNPHWVPELRPLTGLDPQVRAHVEADPAFRPAIERIVDLILHLLPHYRREGRAYATLAFGCTGGRHRSVAVAEAMGERLAEAGWQSEIVHRDRGRPAAAELFEDRRPAALPGEPGPP